MSPKANEKQITVSLSKNLLERLDSMAKHAEISRHKLILNLLSTGIEEIEFFKDVGIFQIAMIIRDMTKSGDKGKGSELRNENISEMPIPVRMEESLVKSLDRLAERGQLTRHCLAKNIIKTGLEQLETAKKFGVTHLFLNMRDLFKDVLEIGKSAFDATREVRKI